VSEVGFGVLGMFVGLVYFFVGLFDFGFGVLGGCLCLGLCVVGVGVVMV